MAQGQIAGRRVTGPQRPAPVVEVGAGPSPAPLCDPCFAEWERVLTPGQQPPAPVRIHHIGDPIGADLNTQALKRADDHWGRVRAYQDYVAARCRAEHNVPRPAPLVVDLPLPDLEEVADVPA